MIICGIKTIRDVSIGDTIITQKQGKDPPKVLKKLNKWFLWDLSVDSVDYAILKDSLKSWHVMMALFMNREFDSSGF